MLAVLTAAITLALPSTGVAIQSRAGVTLYTLDGHAVRTLPHWALETPPVTAPGDVVLRTPGGRWRRLRHGALATIARPRVPTAGGCFATARGLSICGAPYGPGRSRVMRGASRLAGPAQKHGSWLAADASPSGTLVGQWSGLCEIPLAFRLAPLRPLWQSSAGRPLESFVLGWVGERLVSALPVAACGAGARHPGVYVGTTLIVVLRRGDVAALWR